MAFWGASYSDKSSPIKDPKRKFRFMVQMTGFGDTAAALGSGATTAESGELWFAKSVTKPSFTIAAAEHKYLNHTFYYPGSVTWNEITVTMVDPQSPDVAATLSSLIEAQGYQVPTSLDVRSTISKWSAAANSGNIIVTQLDANGDPLETWTLWNGFITEVTYGDLAYGDDELTEMTVKFRYDWAQLDAPGEESGENNEYFQ